MSPITKQISPRKMMVMALGVIIVPLLLLAGYLALKSSSKSEVRGSMRVGADEAITPDRCESGILSEDAPRTRVQFHGVDLFASRSPELRVRALEDEVQGLRVIVRREGSAPVEVDRAACQTFDVQLHETGAMILDHYGLQGSLRLDCPDITADVHFASCYDGT